MPKEELMSVEDMQKHYRKSTKQAFLQAWRKDKKNPPNKRLIPDPINEGSRSLLWRSSDVDRCTSRTKQ